MVLAHLQEGDSRRSFRCEQQRWRGGAVLATFHDYKIPRCTSLTPNVINVVVGEQTRALRQSVLAARMLEQSARLTAIHYPSAS